MNFLTLVAPAVLSLPLGCALIFAPKLVLIIYCLWATIYFVQAPIKSLQCIYQNPIVIPVVTFFLWAVISLAWSIEPLYGLKSTLGGFALGLVALGMGTHLPTISKTQGEFIANLIIFSLLIACAVGIIEWLSNGYVFHWINNLRNQGFPRTIDAIYKPSAFAVSGLAILVIGTFIANKQKSLALITAILTISLCIISKSTTSLLGLLIGGLVFLIALLLPRMMSWVMLGFIFIMNLLLPILLTVLPITQYGTYLLNQFGQQAYSFYHRTIIWDFSLNKWMEAPLLGWGAASSRSIPGSQEEIFLGGKKLSLHSHNHLIQAGLEMGIIGATLYTIILLSVLWMIHTRLKSNVARATALGLFMALYVFCSSEHSLWHHWWIAWMCTFTSLGIVICRRI